MTSTTFLDKLVIEEIKTQSDYLAERIKDMIISNEFPDDYKFPNELEFSKKLNVSRATLREAYKILSAQGFLRITKHGTYVKDRYDIARHGNFTASLDLANEQEMLDFMLAVEPAAVALAAKKITDEELERLEKLMIACENSKEEQKKFMELNRQFHSFIRETTHNTPITSALSAYYDIFDRQIVGKIYTSDMDATEFKNISLAQHRELFAALKNHDAQKAQDVEYKHLVYDIEAHELRFKNVVDSI